MHTCFRIAPACTKLACDLANKAARRVGDFGQVLAPYDGKYDRRRQGKLTKRETQHDGERSVCLSEGAVRNLNNDEHSAARKCRCVDHSRYLRHKPRAVDLDYQ